MTAQDWWDLYGRDEADSKHALLEISPASNSVIDPHWKVQDSKSTTPSEKLVQQVAVKKGSFTNDVPVIGSLDVRIVHTVTLSTDK